MMILCWDFLALRDRHPRFGAWDLGFGDRDAGFLALKKRFGVQAYIVAVNLENRVADYPRGLHGISTYRNCEPNSGSYTPGP